MSRTDELLADFRAHADGDFPVPELAVLRRENAALRQRCEILKKTLGILSEPPNNVSNGSTR